MLSILLDSPELQLSSGTHAGHQFVTAHNNKGHRCGYVKVPGGHPWHGKDYLAIDADCHGGLTFGRRDSNFDGYWVGFSCTESHDEPDPSLLSAEDFEEASYDFYYGGNTQIRTQEFVEKECKSLCEQAHRAGTKP